MGRLDFKPRTLDDDLVKDGLCATSALDNYNISKDLFFVVGGMATQSYLPTSCRRGTSDIDLAILRPLARSEFEGFALGATTYLKDFGYNVELRKGHNSYMLVYSKEGSGSVIEFGRRNGTSFAKISKRLLEERANTRKKIVEGREVTYRVSSPEDIAVPKLVRSVNSLVRNSNFAQYVHPGRKTSLSAEGIVKQLEEIDALRDEALVNIGDTRSAERLRFVSDLFDIRVLSELTGFNEAHLKRAFSYWDSFVKNPNEKKWIFDYVLPKLDLQGLPSN